MTRKKGETIQIAEEIFVTVVSISDNKVRLGIVAAEDIPVHRHEVVEAMRASGQDTKVPGWKPC